MSTVKHTQKIEPSAQQCEVLHEVINQHPGIEDKILDIWEKGRTYYTIGKLGIPRIQARKWVEGFIDGLELIGS